MAPTWALAPNWPLSNCLRPQAPGDCRGGDKPFLRSTYPRSPPCQVSTPFHVMPEA